MKFNLFLAAILVLLVLTTFLLFPESQNKSVLSSQSDFSYWLMLFRKSNVEFLYIGKPGNIKESFLVKTFKVKSGVPGEKPTPLPKLLGRNYWLITEKIETYDSLETAPYFLTLDIPVTEEEPYGPSPYLECNGQCNWIIPGAFGLHGVAGDDARLSRENAGSSGCIRHTDLDITYLYNILDPRMGEIRYYIEDT